MALVHPDVRVGHGVEEGVVVCGETSSMALVHPDVRVSPLVGRQWLSSTLMLGLAMGSRNGSLSAAILPTLLIMRRMVTMAKMARRTMMATLFFPALGSLFIGPP